MTEPADGLRWVSFDADHAIAVQRGALITIWSGELRAAALRLAAAEARTLSQRRPGETSFLNMVVRGTPPPGDEARAEFQSMMREGPGALRCTAIVVEGSGLRGLAVRAVVNGIVMVVRPSFPMKVHAGVAGAAAWIAAQPGPGGVTAGEISGAVDAMRARLRAGV